MQKRVSIKKILYTNIHFFCYYMSVSTVSCHLRKHLTISECIISLVSPAVSNDNCTFMLQHSMIYFFHHYELPSILQQAQLQRMLHQTQHPQAPPAAAAAAPPGGANPGGQGQQPLAQGVAAPGGPVQDGPGATVLPTSSPGPVASNTQQNGTDTSVGPGSPPAAAAASAAPSLSTTRASPSVSANGIDVGSRLNIPQSASSVLPSDTATRDSAAARSSTALPATPAEQGSSSKLPQSARLHIRRNSMERLQVLDTDGAGPDLLARRTVSLDNLRLRGAPRQGAAGQERRSGVSATGSVGSCLDGNRRHSGGGLGGGGSSGSNRASQEKLGEEDSRRGTPV